MGRSLRLLIVEDSEDDALLLVRQITRDGWSVHFERVETEEALAAALDREPWDLVIADYSLPSFSAPQALALLKARDLDLPFIIVSGTIGEAAAVDAMRAGAHDYVMKGNLTRLLPAIAREMDEAEERRGRAQAERALAQEREWSRFLVESGSALIVGLDPEGRISTFNPAAEAFTGYGKEEVRDKNWFDLFTPRDRYPDAWQAFSRLVTSSQPMDTEEPILIATGEERIIAWHRTVLPPESSLSGIVGFGIDVTARRRADQHRLTVERAARQTDKLAALGTMAAGLAHELNNPIGIISSRIELMLLEGEELALPASLSEDLRVIHRHAQRMARLTQGLLSFGRRSSGERRPIDLNQVIEETLLLIGLQITKAGIEIATEFGTIPPILGDSSGLQQVVLNLVSNARDAMAGGAGTIRITTRRILGPPDTVELEVADTGPGIAPEHLAHVFDPFFTTKPSGTGLGLAITYGIVREHEGSIDVESTPHRGTRFVLKFPVLTA
jgi:two-component system cell cycle sensor histidine kinase/response regulator CckA